MNCPGIPSKSTEISARVSEHQRGQTISTRDRGPWILVYQENFNTLAEASRRERQDQLMGIGQLALEIWPETSKKTA